MKQALRLRFSVKKTGPDQWAGEVIGQRAFTELPKVTGRGRGVTKQAALTAALKSAQKAASHPAVKAALPGLAQGIAIAKSLSKGKKYLKKRWLTKKARKIKSALKGLFGG